MDWHLRRPSYTRAIQHAARCSLVQPAADQCPQPAHLDLAKPFGVLADGIGGDRVLLQKPLPRRLSYTRAIGAPAAVSATVNVCAPRHLAPEALASTTPPEAGHSSPQSSFSEDVTNLCQNTASKLTKDSARDDALIPAVPPTPHSRTPTGQELRPNPPLDGCALQVAMGAARKGFRASADVMDGYDAYSELVGPPTNWAGGARARPPDFYAALLAATGISESASSDDDSDDMDGSESLTDDAAGFDAGVEPESTLLPPVARSFNIYTDLGAADASLVTQRRIAGLTSLHQIPKQATNENWSVFFGLATILRRLWLFAMQVS